MPRSTSRKSHATAPTSSTANSITTSRSSSSSNRPTSLAEALDFEGLDHIGIRQLNNIVDVLKAINLQSDKLIAGLSNQQFLVFSDVTQDDLIKIDSERPKYTRVTYYKDINLFIVKLMPSVKHEAAHVNFGKKMTGKIIGMGMSEDDLWATGAGLFQGSSASKEGDTSFKPPSRTNETDWPTIVIEAGLSESLPKLRCDAKWWLTNSSGDVKIVIIILITSQNKSLRIEKWEMVPPISGRRVTRANTPIPGSVQEITIIPDATGAITPNQIIGAPLVMDFHKIFLRQPIPPETDITFSINDLADFATKFWNRSQ